MEFRIDRDTWLEIEHCENNGESEAEAVRRLGVSRAIVRHVYTCVKRSRGGKLFKPATT